MIGRALTLVLAPVVALVSATPALRAAEPALELIMSHPDWIASQPANPYWADDSRSVLFDRKPAGVASGLIQPELPLRGGRVYGLIITTGIFTRDARREATRDGAPPIDLVDRDLLLDKLRELQLGVTVEVVERVSPNPAWFDDL